MRFSTEERTWSRGRKKFNHLGGVRLAAWLVVLLCGWFMLAATSGFLLGTAEGKGSLIPEKGGVFFQSEKVAVYVVKKGDQLSDLARRFYGDPEKGWMIEEANEVTALEPGQVLVIPWRPKNPGGLFLDGYQVVSVLTYHHFSDQCSNMLCMPVDEFARQMAYLKKGRVSNCHHERVATIH